MTDWSTLDREPLDPCTENRVRLGFERQPVTLKVDQIVPLKSLREGVRESRKYAQIVSSIKAIGLVEAPAVVPNPKTAGQYFLLDGHLRIEVLKQLGIDTVECLVANDDETYTYNKRINRLPPVQEHRMIVRAIERGVTEAVIADALGLEVQSIRARFRLLDGICAEAADMLKDTNCSMKVFDMLRRMSTMRQIEAADLMIGQNNYSVIFHPRPARRHPARSVVGDCEEGAEERHLRSDESADFPDGTRACHPSNSGKVSRGQLRDRQSPSHLRQRLHCQIARQCPNRPLAVEPSARIPV